MKKEKEMSHLGNLAEEFIGLKKANRDLDEEKKKNNGRITELESMIIDSMQQQDLEKISTEDGTLSVKITQLAQFDNDQGGSDAFFEWVAKTEAWEYLYKRVNSAPVKMMLETSGVIPPGVKIFEKVGLNSRAKPKTK